MGTNLLIIVIALVFLFRKGYRLDDLKRFDLFRCFFREEGSGRVYHKKGASSEKTPSEEEREESAC